MFHARHEPTPEEIRLACEAIQAKWSRAETEKRAGVYRNERPTIPVVHLGELAQSDDEQATASQPL